MCWTPARRPQENETERRKRLDTKWVLIEASLSEPHSNVLTWLFVIRDIYLLWLPNKMADKPTAVLLACVNGHVPCLEVDRPLKKLTCSWWSFSSQRRMSQLFFTKSSFASSIKWSRAHTGFTRHAPTQSHIDLAHARRAEHAQIHGWSATPLDNMQEKTSTVLNWTSSQNFLCVPIFVSKKHKQE